MKTLELGVKRRYLGEQYSIGTFSIDAVRLCDSLEDKNRDLNHDGDLDDPGEGKVYGQTCIPYGRYKVVMAMYHHGNRMAPLLVGVKTHSDIFIHAGNTPEDTLGCILPGENKEKGKVLNSRHYEDIISANVTKAEAEGIETYITIS